MKVDVDFAPPPPPEHDASVLTIFMISLHITPIKSMKIMCKDIHVANADAVAQAQLSLR